MFPIPLPAFQEQEYFDNRENAAAGVVLIPGASADRFDAYCALLESNGFAPGETFQTARQRFAAYQKDSWGVFLNYFYGTAELQLVTERNTAYFSYGDRCAETAVAPQITQVWLEDFGMSYAVRLPDGRFLVIDGGRRIEEDAARLFECLKAGTPHEKPVIAAWLMSHPHADHYHCFFPFMERYGEQVTVEKFFFNFPEAEDVGHYPKLAASSAEFEGMTAGDVLRLFLKKVEALGVPVYRPHTGQRYALGGTQLRFLASMDDTIHCSANINATSLVFTLELAGQTVFWGADASFADARLAERYGEALKADILQVPHHGFGSGSAKGQIDCYEQIRPQVCLLPVSDYHAYTAFCTYKEGTEHLMTRMDIAEMLVGDATHTLTLPYAPKAETAELQRKFLRGRDDSGARTWVYTDLDTDREADFVFSVLNTTYAKAEIKMELFFADMPDRLHYADVTVPARGCVKISCLAPEGQAPWIYDPNALLREDIPAGTSFAVRFLSSIPVVISHKDHMPAYRSSVV